MKKTCVAVLTIGMAILWAGGCQEEQQISSGDKMARLMALENRGLNRQLQQEAKKHDEEIKNLNTQMQTETKKRDDEIKKLNSQIQKRDEGIENLSSQMQKWDEEIKNLKIQLQTETKKRDDEIKILAEQLTQCEQDKRTAIDESQQKEAKEKIGEIVGAATLMNENAELKAEIAQLKAELADLKGKK